MKKLSAFVLLSSAALFAAVAPKPVLGQALSVDEIRIQIANILKQISIIQAAINDNDIGNDNGGSQPSAFCYSFNRGLGMGSSGSDVRALNQALAKEGFDVSPTSETYNDKTASAVSGFQEKYRGQILEPIGLRFGTGYFGNASRKVMNNLYSCNGQDQDDIGKRGVAAVRVQEVRYCVTAPCDAPAIKNATVSVYDSAGKLMETRPVSASGLATFSRLPFGNYTARATAQGYGETSATFTVQGNKPVSVTISMPVIPTTNASGITVSAMTDKVHYGTSENIGITLTAKNISSENRSLYFPNGCQAKFKIDGSYDSQQDIMCTMMTATVDFAPGQERVWQLAYDQQSKQPLSLGWHKITGILNSNPELQAVTYIHVMNSPTTVPAISTISPTSGRIGTAVTITGTNFLSADNAVRFGFGYIPGIASNNGNTLSFQVPESLNPSCYYSNPRCLIASQQTAPGDYDISVVSANGESNKIKFTVTSE